MSAAPCRVLAFAALAAALPAPALASLYTDAVETAVFGLCPALRSGRISGEPPTELTRLGYRRTPEVEEDWTDAEDGAPYIFVRGNGAGVVRLAYWSFPELCSVQLEGSEGAAAVARVKARMAREPRVYRRATPNDSPLDDVGVEAWRVFQRRAMCLAIISPERNDRREGFEILLQPFPPLHPGMSNTLCAPAPPPVDVPESEFDPRR